MSNDGRLLYSTLLSGLEQELVPDIAAAPNGNVVIGMIPGSRDVTGSDFCLPSPRLSNLVLLRLAATITATPSQVTLANSTTTPILRLETTPELEYESTASTESTATWLRVAPPSGTTAASTQLTVSVNPSAASLLPPGTHRGAITISTSEGGLLRVPVTFEVGAPITVAPSAVTLSAVTANLAPRLHAGSITLSAGSTTAAAIPVSLNITSGPDTITANVAEAHFRWNRDFPLPQQTRVFVTIRGSPALLTATSSAAWRQASVPSAAQTLESVTIRAAPDGLADGFYEGRVTIRGGAAALNCIEVPFWFTVAAAGPTITREGVVNAASLVASPIAPNQILSLFGSGLQCAGSQAAILLSGAPAVVLASTPRQINFATPAVLPAGPLRVSYRCATTESAQLLLESAVAGPALFTFPGTGKGNAASINEDGSFNGAAPGLAPSQPGGVIQLFGTGFGSYGPPAADGLVRLLQPVRATVGGIPAQVLFAGQAPGSTNGRQQINILLGPGTPTGDAQPVELEVGGVSIPAGVTLAIR